MGFFKDFKRDFAQAVNELMPDKDEVDEEYDDEDMVNTFDEDNEDVAPEDLLEDLDKEDFDDYGDIGDMEDIARQNSLSEKKYEDSEETGVSDSDRFDNIPYAEVLYDDKEKAVLNEEYSETELADFEKAQTSYEGYSSYNDDNDKLYKSDNSDYDELLSITDESETLDSNYNDNDAEADESEEINIEAYDKEAIEETNVDTLDISEETIEESVSKSINVEDELNAMDIGKAIADSMGADNSEDEKVQEEIVADIPKESTEEDTMAEISEVKELEKEIENKEQDATGILSDDTTYITKATTIKGDVVTDGGVDIIGTVEGNVDCKGKLIVGGNVKGTVKAGELYANAAKIEGEITVEGAVKIGVGSIVVGNVNSTSAVIAGAVNGDIDVHGPVIVDSTAVIMGNIKSRSVQINNGAVIEGFCSQCYSEIDVKSFFE